MQLNSAYHRRQTHPTTPDTSYSILLGKAASQLIQHFHNCAKALSIDMEVRFFYNVYVYIYRFIAARNEYQVQCNCVHISNAAAANWVNMHSVVHPFTLLNRKMSLESE